MSIYDNLGAPELGNIQTGYYKLHRFHAYGKGVGVVVPYDINGVDSITADAPAPAISKKVFQQGGNGESAQLRRLFSFNGSINMHPGRVAAFLAYAQGITNDISNYAGLSFIPTPYPTGLIESVIRGDDGVTIKGIRVFQDIVWQPFNFNDPMEDENAAVKFSSEHYPVICVAGVELKYEEFTGDGSTVVFTLNAIPIPIAQATIPGNEDFPLEVVFFVKKKLTGASTGVRQTDVTIVPSAKTVTFDTAAAAASTIGVAYITAAAAL